VETKVDLLQQTLPITHSTLIGSRMNTER